ncbi:MAG TPA: hypothetical protein VN938_13280, partial [Xanthobacteraceae bacterium]|nr:hypothetical protein [Xanthobacteraceae bacterium]
RARAELQRALAEIKATGYATSSRTRRLVDEISLSVPVLLHDRALASLTARFAASVVPLKSGVERFLPKLRRCAANISSSFLQLQAEARTNGPRETAA